MGRILHCECKREVSSFNPVMGLYEDFIVTRGAELLACRTRCRRPVFPLDDIVEWIPMPHIFERRNRRHHEDP